MNMNSRRLITIALCLLLTVLLVSCGGKHDTGGSTSNNAPNRRRTGQIQSTAETKLATITWNGSSYTFTQPGSPLNGLTIESTSSNLPANTSIRLLQADITGNTFEQPFGVKALTPLIALRSVATSIALDSPLIVTIPVSISANAYPVCYSYNPITRELEPQTVIARGANYVSILLYHLNPDIGATVSTEDTFPFFVGQRAYGSSRASGRVNSGFLPGLDDWPFINTGTTAFPNGQCAGQSITMAWYFVNKYQTGKFDRLRANGYFNGGTPSYWQDDRNGIRFASRVHSRYQYLQSLDVPPRPIPERDLIAFVRDEIAQTNQPQIIYIFKTNVLGRYYDGHAIVCYAADDTTLYIADPNTPGNTGNTSLGIYKIQIDPVTFLTIPFGFRAVFNGQATQYDTFYPFPLKNLNTPLIESDFQEAVRGQVATELYQGPGYSARDFCDSIVAKRGLNAIDNFSLDNPLLKITLPDDTEYISQKDSSFFNSIASTLSTSSTAAVPYIADTNGGNAFTTTGELTKNAGGQYELNIDPQFAPDTKCDFCANMEPDPAKGTKTWNIHLVLYRDGKWFDALQWKPRFQFMKLISRGREACAP